jgi:4-amino-4-deoxy-L-arabinose transferase-like glycosyltransferase
VIPPSLGLAIIVVVAVLMRLPPLLYDGLWRDEAYVYIDVIAPTFHEFLHRVTETEWHPPLFFLLTYLWVKIAGVSELSLKILPFLFSILTVPAVYRLGKATSSKATGLLAAAIFALSPSAIMYSSDYLYPLMGLLCTILAALILTGRREHITVKHYAAIAVVTVLVVYTHYFALIYMPLLMLWALCSPRGIRHGLALASALVLGALPFALWVPVFLNQRHIGLPYVPSPSLLERLWFMLSALQFMPARPLLLALTLFFFVVLAIAALVRDRIVNVDALALGSIVFLVLLFAAAENLRILHYVLPFYGLFSVALAWIIASFIQQIMRQDLQGWRRWGLGVAVVSAAACAIGDVTAVVHANAIPLSGIRTFVATQPLQSTTLYVIAPDYLAATFAFYARDTHVRDLGFVQVQHPEVYALQGMQADWGRPSAVADGLRTIAREAGHYRYLDLVINDYAASNAAVAFGKVWQLRNALERRYRLLGFWHYAGTFEPVSVYRFAIARGT